MAQTMLDIEAILRRLNKIYSKDQPLNKRNIKQGGHRGNRVGTPPITKHLPQIKKDTGPAKKKQQTADEQILKGRLSWLKNVPPAKGAHDRPIKDIVDRDKNRSSTPVGKLPSKGVNHRAALERRLKNKNYTQTGEDAQWHRDRRVKKSQGRPIEETPKQKKARKQVSQEALLRRRRSV